MVGLLLFPALPRLPLQKGQSAGRPMGGEVSSTQEEMEEKQVVVNKQSCKIVEKVASRASQRPVERVLSSAPRTKASLDDMIDDSNDKNVNDNGVGRYLLPRWAKQRGLVKSVVLDSCLVNKDIRKAHVNEDRPSLACAGFSFGSHEKVGVVIDERAHPGVRGMIEFDVKGIKV